MQAAVLYEEEIEVQQQPHSRATILDYGKQKQLSQYLQRSVRDLADELAAETLKFQAHQPHTDLAGLALFTLAILHNNQDAWTVLYEQYTPLVLAWATQKPLIVSIVAQDGDMTSLLNSVFTKFFHAVTPEKFQGFSSLAALLKYLQLCTRSVVYDEVCHYRAHPVEASLDEVEQELVVQDFTESTETGIRARRFWQIVRDELRDDGDRLLIHQLYCLDMRPVEIYRLDNTYPTLDAVYNRKRRIMERLKRSARFRNAVRDL